MPIEPACSPHPLIAGRNRQWATDRRCRPRAHGVRAAHTRSFVLPSDISFGWKDAKRLAASSDLKAASTTVCGRKKSTAYRYGSALAPPSRAVRPSASSAWVTFCAGVGAARACAVGVARQGRWGRAAERQAAPGARVLVQGLGVAGPRVEGLPPGA
eukprot:7377383-Prymnesium_polylepis.1